MNAPRENVHQPSQPGSPNSLPRRDKAHAQRSSKVGAQGPRSSFLKNKDVGPKNQHEEQQAAARDHVDLA